MKSETPNWDEYKRMMTTERNHVPNLHQKEDLWEFGAWLVGTSIRENAEAMASGETEHIAYARKTVRADWDAFETEVGLVTGSYPTAHDRKKVRDIALGR